MTEYVKELLEDIQLGDWVRITYGNNHDMAEGVIQKISDNFITLETASGKKSKIGTDLLRAMVVIEAPVIVVKPQPKPSVAPSIQRSFVEIPDHTVYPYTTEDALQTLTQLRKASEKALSSGVDGIMSSLRDALRTGSLQSKYHTLRMKTLMLWEQCTTADDYRCFYYLLGVLALECKEFTDAYEPMVRAQKYGLAAYAAAKAKDSSKELSFYLCALLDKDPQSRVDKLIVESCISRTDVSAFSALLDTYEDDPKVCEVIASCAFAAFQSLGDAMPLLQLGSGTDPVTAAKALIRAMPQVWRQQSQLLRHYQEYSNYHYPVVIETDKEYTAVIDKYDVRGNWGFLQPAKTPPCPITGQLFFHISQIGDEHEDDLLLRKLLMADRGKGLEVSFYIGRSNRASQLGKPSATDIILTENCLEEAANRLTSPKMDILTGYIQDGYKQGNGVIRNGSKRYSFNETAIIDPRLVAYYKNCFSPVEQDVSFRAVRIGSKEYCALDICWLNPRQQDLDTYCYDVPGESLKKWEAQQELRNAELSGVTDTKDVTAFPFVSLETWVPASRQSTKPLTWSVASAAKTVSKQVVSTPVKKEQEQTKVSAPRPEENILAKSYTDYARKALLDNDLEKAETAFLNALELGASPDSVVGDLVTLYLRQPERLSKCLQLIDKYEKQLPPEKVLNLRVSTYEKLKDYDMLCKLYDEVFCSSSSVSRKSHALVRQAVIHVSRGRYQEALQVAQSWQQLFQKNRYSTDSAKLHGTKPIMERQQAIALYHTGHIEEARMLAVDLVRSNPGDTDANAILDGTLVAKNVTQEESSDIYLSDLELIKDEEATGQVSQLPRLVLHRIQNTDIGEVLKTSNIKEKKYVGTVAQANEDINTLNAKTGNTPRSRSTNLFAICRIVSDVESREQKNVWESKYSYRLAGRAMASLGDYLVSVSSQMDTARTAYLYAIQMLARDEQDAVNAYNRYLKSYFISRSDLSKYVSIQTNSRNKDGANTDIFTTHQLPEVLIPEFFVGMLQLLDALESHPFRQKQLISDLFSRNKTLSRQVINQMSEFLSYSENDTGLTADNFSERMFFAMRQLNAQTKVLSNALKDLADNFLEQFLNNDDLNAIGSINWRNNLNATDFTRLQKLYYILRRGQEYHEDSDFENRADCLRAAISEAKELLEAIDKEPTALSFDVFLPALDSILLRLTEHREILYREHQPRLSLRESIQPFKTRDGMIQIQLLLKNEQNCQTADTVRMVPVVEGDVVEALGSTTLNSLRGGEEREMLATLNITSEAMRAGSFRVTLCCSYRRNRTDHSVEQLTYEQVLVLVLKSEDFVPLVNPFKDHIGKPMSDATMFYGRGQQIDQMVEMLLPQGSEQMNYGRAIAMFGQTRTGKSSLLYHFQNKLKQQCGQHVVIWDMGNIGELSMDANAGNYLPTFLYTMLSIGEEALEDHYILGDAVAEAALDAPLELIRKEPEFAMLHFASYMRKLNRILKAQNCIIVLFVDEFTYLHSLIRSGHLSGEFMKFWKAFLQDYCVFAVIAGQDDTPEFMREYPNEFACMEALKVTYLNEIPAKQLIREPLERINNRSNIFHTDAVDEIYRLTAGSAYLTMLFCSNLVNYLNEKGASIVTRGMLADFVEKKVFSDMSFLEENNFEPQIRERGHEELDFVNRQLLHCVAKLSQNTGRADISRLTCTDENGEPLSLDEIHRLVERLVDRNVLVCDANEHCWIQVKLLEQWLLHTMGV